MSYDTAIEICYSDIDPAYCFLCAQYYCCWLIYRLLQSWTPTIRSLNLLPVRTLDLTVCQTAMPVKKSFRRSWSCFVVGLLSPTARPKSSMTHCTSLISAVRGVDLMTSGSLPRQPAADAYHQSSHWTIDITSAIPRVFVRRGASSLFLCINRSIIYKCVRLRLHIPSTYMWWIRQ